jgi:hypothetical protein
MYEDAPYDFQRQYRTLDAIIQMEIRSGDETDVEFDRNAIRKQVHEFIDSFPEDEFREYVNDLYLWYDLLSNILDDEAVTLGQVEDIAEFFWTIIMLDLATSPKTGINPDAFADELNIDDPYDLQEYLRYRLRQLEQSHLEVESASGHTVEAADAVMVSQLDFAEI